MECMTTWPGTLRETRTAAVCLTTFLRRSGSFSVRRHFVSCLYFSLVHIWHRFCLEKQNKLAPNTNFAFLVTPPQARAYEENISSAARPFLHFFFFSSRHQQRFSVRLRAIHLKRSQSSVSNHFSACVPIGRPPALHCCVLTQSSGIYWFAVWRRFRPVTLTAHRAFRGSGGYGITKRRSENSCLGDLLRLKFPRRTCHGGKTPRRRRQSHTRLRVNTQVFNDQTPLAGFSFGPACVSCLCHCER